MLARTLRTGKSDSRGSIAAEQHDARAERAERRPRVELVAVAGGSPGCALDAGERAKELHLPVALGACDPEDLALRDVEVDRPESLASQARDGEQHLARSPSASRRSGKASWSGRPIMRATRLSSDMSAAS